MPKYYKQLKTHNMAQMVQLTVVQKNQYAVANEIWAVPVSAFIATPSTQVAGAATLVLVAPTGLNQPTTKLYVAETVAEIATAANA